MGLFSKEKGKPEVETGFSAPKTEHRPVDNVTRAVKPEEVGATIFEDGSSSFGGVSKEQKLRLPKEVLLGSEYRQRRLEENKRSDEELDRELHVAELSTDFSVPNGEIYSHREFSYVQTPDGRLHSDKCVTDLISGDPAYKKYVKNGERKIIQERSIGPEGRVTLNKRTVEKDGGTKEEVVEKLAYDEQGTVVIRERTSYIDGKEVYAAETRLDTENPQDTVTTFRHEERPGFKTKIGQKFTNNGEGKNFSNGFHSEVCYNLED